MNIHIHPAAFEEMREAIKFLIQKLKGWVICFLRKLIGELN